ncbi:NAD-binding protein [Priestia megaterium]|uniref:NAD-binding protein n=1 Tax=Priestia megaterium TaxID=1404 RepID=UPI002E24FEBB|nr:NAD-binding protein [Priestia megaterium]MED4241142.1 NAD-binding protein [Priestia megaterium]MED4268379.1 NAD-binding protein [Priestia megaterium]MED4279260.1 NAD-binding protein [Priestia megaterium]MED4314650.1 NAD-binding protein [Priestia megaterium]
MYKGNNHFVIIGWNERVKNLLSYFEEPLILNKMVLIDNTLEENHLLPGHIYFIKGDPQDPETLVKANIQYATTLLITADLDQLEEEADINSILSLIASKGQNPSIYSIVEILTSKHSANAKHAGADQIIHRSLPISRLMYDKFFSGKIS